MQIWGKLNLRIERGSGLDKLVGHNNVNKATRKLPRIKSLLIHDCLGPPNNMCHYHNGHNHHNSSNNHHHHARATARSICYDHWWRFVLQDRKRCDSHIIGSPETSAKVPGGTVGPAWGHVRSCWSHIGTRYGINTFMGTLISILMHLKMNTI